MEIMQLIGIGLIAIVILLYYYWIQFIRRQTGVKARKEGGVQIFDILVKGVYTPNVIEAKVNKPVKINFIRQEDSECSRFVTFSDFNIRKELPKNKIVSIELTPQKTGEYLFSCDMGMYQGKLIVE